MLGIRVFGRRGGEAQIFQSRWNEFVFEWGRFRFSPRKVEMSSKQQYCQEMSLYGAKVRLKLIYSCNRCQKSSRTK